MSEQQVAVGGGGVRRQFERSRLEDELFEAVYDALLAGGPEAGPSEPAACVRATVGTGVAAAAV